MQDKGSYVGGIILGLLVFIGISVGLMFCYLYIQTLIFEDVRFLSSDLYRETWFIILNHVILIILYYLPLFSWYFLVRPEIEATQFVKGITRAAKFLATFGAYFTVIYVVIYVVSDGFYIP